MSFISGRELVKVMGKGIPGGYAGRGTAGMDKDKVLRESGRRTNRRRSTLNRETMR